MYLSVGGLLVSLKGSADEGELVLLGEGLQAELIDVLLSSSDHKQVHAKACGEARQVKACAFERRTQHCVRMF
jgi:hypothetical protein